MDFDIEVVMLRLQATALSIIGIGNITDIAMATWMGVLFALPGALYYATKYYKEFIKRNNPEE